MLMFSLLSVYPYVVLSTFSKLRVIFIATNKRAQYNSNSYCNHQAIIFNWRCV